MKNVFRLLKQNPTAQSLKKTWIVRRLRLELRNRKIIPRLYSQLRDASVQKPDAHSPRQKVLVPLIEASHYQFFQVLLVAKALELRGAEVKVLLCDSVLRGCELKNVKEKSFEDPCMNCRVNSKQLVKLFNLNLISLRDYLSDEKLKQLDTIAMDVATAYPSSYIYGGINIIPICNDSVTRYFYGAVPDEGTRELQEARARSIASVLLTIECGQEIQKTWDPDVVFNNMNVYVDWAPYFVQQNRLGKKSSTTSITSFNYDSVVMNLADLFNPSRFERWLKNRNGVPLTVKEREELFSFLDSRTSGAAISFEQLGFFDSSLKPNDFLKIDKSKKNLFLFSNVFWDVGILGTESLYRDVIDWVLDTIDIIKNRTDIHLYIKPHPAEVYDTASSLKGVREFINQKYPVLPENITIIEPEWKIKTYDLFPFIDSGIVYNGTLGLEMMLSGIPIIVAGIAPYSKTGIGNEPNDRDSYMKMLTGQLDLIKPDRVQSELFAYFYFIKACVPWKFTKSAYSDNNFDGFTFESIDELKPGKNKIMDHICNCIMEPEKYSPEEWTDL